MDFSQFTELPNIFGGGVVGGLLTFIIVREYLLRRNRKTNGGIENHITEVLAEVKETNQRLERMQTGLVQLSGAVKSQNDRLMDCMKRVEQAINRR